MKADAIKGMRIAREAMPPDIFKMAMRCERVERLREYLEACIDLEFYEEAAVIHRLLDEREGKVELWSSRNIPVYF